MSGFTARNKVAIVGYAHSSIQQHAAAPLGSLTLETARRAITDAGLRVDQIDGFASSAMLPTAGSHTAEDGISMVTSTWLADRLGINPRYAVGFQGNGQLPGSVSLAVNAIVSGAADYVVVSRALHNPPGRYHGNSMSQTAGPMQWAAPQGFFGPLAMIGLTYNEYLQRFNASREAMATVLVEARKNGARIPWSYWYGRPLTREKYLDAPLLADPIGRLDCDIPVDGAAAFVLTSAERAADLPNRPVYISGIAAGNPTKRRIPLHWPLDDLYETGSETARRLWTAAGVGPEQVDLPQLYDGFSPFVYLWLEILGFCPIGEAHRFVQDGRIDSDAADGLPILSGGGALGNGRMHGVPQMLECYLQLSGRAGERQRNGATVGLACHSSPHLGGAVVYTNAPT
jgi:acetyl-CoA acetyltransferase